MGKIARRQDSAADFGYRGVVSTVKFPNARQQYRTRMRKKQITVFTVTVLTLALLLTTALAIVTDVLPVPFGNEFASDPPQAIAGEVPCPLEESVAIPLDQIKLKILNATEHSGLAKTASEDLALLGIPTEELGNSEENPTGSSAMIITGPRGVVAAYTLSRYIPDVSIVLDDRTDDVIDLVLGETYTAPITKEEAAEIIPEETFQIPEGCAEISPEDAAPAPEETTPVPEEPAPAPE